MVVRLADRIRAVTGRVDGVPEDVVVSASIGFESYDPGEQISPETLPYLRDAQDHAVQALDMVENERELATGLIELHLAAQSQRMNEVMKVLTIISTIFIPLTFVVGVYGMNFDPEAGPWSMPELKSPYGYAACLAAMAAIALSSWWGFRHRGWIGRESEQ